MLSWNQITLLISPWLLLVTTYVYYQILVRRLGAKRGYLIQLRQYGKDAYLHEDKKHLIIPAKIGKSLKIKMHRPLEGTPRTVHLVLRADGSLSP